MVRSAKRVSNHEIKPVNLSSFETAQARLLRIRSTPHSIPNACM
jgi:hypothetical protein